MAESDPLAWLQNWYLDRCDGDWEHDHGVTIETLDNPGWRLTIDLRHTAFEDRAFTRAEHGDPGGNLEEWQSRGSWWVCDVQAGKFQAHCGPLDLPAVIDLFRDWAATA